MSNKELIAILRDLGIAVKSHSSTIEEADAEAVRELLRAEREERKLAVKAKRPPKKALPKKAPEARHRRARAPSPTPRRAKKAKMARPAPAPTPEPTTEEVLEIEEQVSIRELAELLEVEVSSVLATLMATGLVRTINQPIEAELAIQIGEQYGKKLKLREKEPEPEAPPTRERRVGEVPVPPVVTVLGHVDHGKTTLLDTIRHTNVTATEAGGITQHIGAYEVLVDGHRITFLDTPGHEAFTAMRARGAQVTDIVVLVVAADDGVMPQTIEAINHAKAAGVPIIVAINKIDRPEANVERVKRQLMEHGLVPEEWGGDTICVPISALHGEGVEDLLESILLVAEIEELRGTPTAPAKGTVIEAHLDKGRGPVATILVKDGTLRVGDALVIGAVYGRVRTMINDKGEKVKEAGPSTPVEVQGLSEVPEVGTSIEVVGNEREARRIAEERQIAAREERLRGTQPRRLTLEDLLAQQPEEKKKLNVILKADVQGSVEALTQSLERLNSEEVEINFIHAGVGNIGKSDIMLAAASEAIIIGFNVEVETHADRQLAADEGIEIRLYQVIYRVLDEVRAALAGMLEPEYEEVILGHAEVLQLFQIARVGTVAGCRVLDGRVVRGSQVRVAREQEVIYEGTLTSLRRYTEDVEEVSEGLECGIALDGFNDFREGDILESFTQREVPRTLPA